jgi:hypothetical protein
LVHYRIHSSTTLVPILNQTIRHHVHSSYVFNIHFNIALSLTHSYFPTVPNETFVRLSSHWCLLLWYGASSVCGHRRRPPGMQARCECIEKDVSNSPQRTIVQPGDLRVSSDCSAKRQVKRKVTIQNTVFMRN